MRVEVSTRRSLLRTPERIGLGAIRRPRFESAGYVAVRTGYLGKVPRTLLSMTPAGRAAFAAHLEVLRQIAG